MGHCTACQPVSCCQLWAKRKERIFFPFFLKNPESQVIFGSKVNSKDERTIEESGERKQGPMALDSKLGGSAPALFGLGSFDPSNSLGSLMLHKGERWEHGYLVAKGREAATRRIEPPKRGK